MVKINTEEGVIRISGEVFTTLAGAAATSCFGVRGMAKKSASDGLQCPAKVHENLLDNRDIA